MWRELNKPWAIKPWASVLYEESNAKETIV